ncbi:Aldehyde/histidinol dehydrogenase [Cladochytrium replicatum]|nr:Aldehyde/histidinol dehydrogenase [Cladochytrium replicatum]
MTVSHEILSPFSNSVVASVPVEPESSALAKVAAAAAAFESWKSTTVETRVNIISKAIDAFLADKDAIANELANLIARPLTHCYNEVRGFEERARHMTSIAASSLADVPVPSPPNTTFKKFIRRVPLGVVFVVAAWNYPYLVAVNAVVPALLAGNTVLLKHAPQTFPCADRFAKAFEAAGLPKDVFQVLHVDHQVAAKVIDAKEVSFVQFTGSVRGGLQVNKAASHRPIGVGMELGGKDPAYVRADADVASAAENIVDGAMYNSGQSCCAVERVYVHESVFDEFISKAVNVVKLYKLGDPFDKATNLGPVISVRAAETIRGQVLEAVSHGAVPLVDESLFPEAKPGSAFVAPQILINVNHDMKLMTEETFGPVVGVMKVKDDDEAVKLMNDSEFGLTASVWTRDNDAALALADRLEAGTIFQNRCDYLDPGLAWVGVKNSGRGCSLSKYGFDALTRPKSYHLRQA